MWAGVEAGRCGVREGGRACLQLDADVRLLRAEHVLTEAALDADDLRDAVHRVAVAVADVDAHERADERALKVRLLQWRGRRGPQIIAGRIAHRTAPNCAELRSAVPSTTAPSSSA